MLSHPSLENCPKSSTKLRSGKKNLHFWQIQIDRVMHSLGPPTEKKTLTEKVAYQKTCFLHR